MIKVKLNLPITLFASLLDSTCCWTKSCLLFPADRSRRSTTMSGRRGLTLPEKTIEKNTHRLPPKDVVHSHAITMSWRNVTSTPALLHEHHGRHSPLPVVDGHMRLTTLVVVRDVVAYQQLWPFLPGSKHDSQDYHKGFYNVPTARIFLGDGAS